MIPLYLLFAATIVLRMAGSAGVRALESWRAALCYGLAIMFLFTGATHFTAMKQDYAAMLPPPLTGALWIVYLTGALEIAGALGLLLPSTRKPAGICLLLFLLAVFPANVHAAINAVPFRGSPPSHLWLRGLVQLVYLAAVWWGAVARTGASTEYPSTT